MTAGAWLRLTVVALVAFFVAVAYFLLAAIAPGNAAFSWMFTAVAPAHATWTWGTLGVLLTVILFLRRLLHSCFGGGGQGGTAAAA